MDCNDPLLSRDAIVKSKVSDMGEKSEDQTLRSFLDTVEQQQRWIRLICDRASSLSLESSDRKSHDQAMAIEFAKLEASVAVMSNLGREVGDFVNRSMASSSESAEKLERTVETLQEELMAVQGDRIRAEVEAKRQLQALEESFEKVAREKESEFSSLQRAHITTVQENETLRQQLETERTLNRGLQSRQRLEQRNEIRTDAHSSLLLSPLLDALWQITSDSKQAMSALQGSPKLLELFCETLHGMTPKSPKSASTSGHSVNGIPNLSLLPGICGILVNLAATSDGRRAIAETRHGELLKNILELIDGIREVDVAMNSSSSATGGESDSGGFNRESARKSAMARVTQESEEMLSDAKQLLLCIVSNLCAEKTIAIRLIEAGMVAKMLRVFESEKSEPLRRYAVSIVKSTLDYVQYVGKRSVGASKMGDRARMEGKVSDLSSEDVYAAIGDLIRMLSKDSKMKMVGLELLGELQRVLPMED